MPALNIVCVNPLDHAESIKELFRSHDRPEFPEYFDRAYPSAVRNGAKSWIGADSDGRVMMHVARFSRRFALGDHTGVAGLLVNLMVAQEHRTFLPALTLLRKAVADSKAARDIDFLYGDPNPRAERLLRAAGLVRIGTLERFVLPLADPRWYADVGVRLYLTLLRLRARRPRLAGKSYAAQHFDADALERPLRQAPTLRPFRPTELYHERLPAFPGPTDTWFTFQENGGSVRPAAAVLVRGESDRSVQLVSLTRDPAVPVFAIVPALAASMRDARYRQLWISALSEGEFARELKRAGFFLRHKNSPVMACPVTDLGGQAVRLAERWEITDLDCDQ